MIENAHITTKDSRSKNTILNLKKILRTLQRPEKWDSKKETKFTTHSIDTDRHLYLYIQLAHLYEK